MVEERGVGAGLPRDVGIAGQARSHGVDAYWINPNSRANAL